MRASMMAVAAVATALAAPAAAQDFVIGVTGALTGPAAGTTGPGVDGLRVYFDRLNKAGGINGKQVRLVLQDDQGEPSKAAANAKKLLTQDNVILLINASLSSTYAPVVAVLQHRLRQRL
jgi:branched-chain amino acid transport system substrate-binding protein